MSLQAGLTFQKEEEEEVMEMEKSQVLKGISGASSGMSSGKDDEQKGRQQQHKKTSRGRQKETSPQDLQETGMQNNRNDDDQKI